MDGEPEAYVDESLRSIGISPRERLARIEQLLVDIGQKLDNKASREEMLALEVRIWQIEVKGSNAANEALNEARRLARERVEDLEQLEAEVKMLSEQHADLKAKLAYIAGGIAVVAVAGEAIINRWLG